MKVYKRQYLTPETWIRRKRTEDLPDKCDRIYTFGDGRFIAKEFDDLADPEGFRVRVSIAGSSEFATPIVGWIEADGVMAGWVEPYIENLQPFRYFECEEDVFRAHCLHQVRLIDCGYIELDPATINWATTEHDRMFTFDKDAVFPIGDKTEKRFSLSDGVYFRLLRQSYQTISDEMQRKISEAFWTRDKKDMQRAMWKCYEALA